MFSACGLTNVNWNVSPSASHTIPSSEFTSFEYSVEFSRIVDRLTQCPRDRSSGLYLISHESLRIAERGVLIWGSSLCNLCVLCASVVIYPCKSVNHRDTENTEVAQRNPN